jgi:hypothetical protein
MKNNYFYFYFYSLLIINQFDHNMMTYQNKNITNYSSSLLIHHFYLIHTCSDFFLDIFMYDTGISFNFNENGSLGSYIILL